jgi:3-hydroxybutyryl-CoA dehydrogenase
MPGVLVKKPKKVFIHMSNICILSTSDHPWFEILKNINVPFYDMKTTEFFEQRWSHYEKFDYIFDFTVLKSEQKKTLLQKITKELKCPIVSDLSLHWVDGYINEFPLLSGAISGVFFSPKNSHEVWAKDANTHQAILDIITKLKKDCVRVTSPGIGFTYPRTISMIINEAYFALEENLANPEDLDEAMKLGVNYPLGPLDWSHKIGPKHIVTLLDELLLITKNPRYAASPLLRLKAIKG